MRKLFSIFAAALIAITVSAKVVHITPTAPRTQDNIRYALRDSLTADTIMLAEGTYVEANSIVGDRNIVIMPEEGAKPVVQLATAAYIKVQNGANIVVEGLKFDGATNGTNYGLRPYDASNSTLKVKGCEFYGFTKNIITADGAQHMSSLIIDDCYFHDNTRAAVYFAASTDAEGSNICDYLEVRNTTIANVSTLSGAGAIDIRNNNENQSAETVTLIVDHCTFYNIQGYERVVQSYKSPLVSVSNCIFMQPEPATNYAIWAYGGNVKNCLVYNFAGSRDWDACPTYVNMLNVDPQFVNAAEGNYNLSEGSPALTAAEDGGAIGDPRWVPAPYEPQMKTIYCKMAHNWWTKDGAAIGIYTWDEGGTPKTAWPGDRMALVEGEADLWSFELDINTYKNCIFTRVNGEGDIADWGAKTADLTIPTDENDMFTITNDDPTWGDPGCAGIWSKYGEGQEGIINTNAAVKTVKMIENGQVVIIKNGVRYNVLGTVIR